MKGDREIFGIPVSGEFESDASRQLHNAIQGGNLFGSNVEPEVINDGIAQAIPIDDSHIGTIVKICFLIYLLATLGWSIYFHYNSPNLEDTIYVETPYKFIDFKTAIVARTYDKVGNPIKSYTIFNKIPSNAVYDEQRYNECMAAYWFNQAYLEVYDKKGFIAQHYGYDVAASNP